jgi:nucleoside-diphosphate-sugar epimerase
MLMQKLFITGGAGFIGSAFVRLALERWPSCEVVNFDALTYAGNLDNLRDLDETRHRFVKGDIADKQAVFDALATGVDAIVNFAAESHVDRSIFSADEFIRTNVSGTQVLLDCARQRNVRRFLQVSTDEKQPVRCLKGWSGTPGARSSSHVRVGHDNHALRKQLWSAAVSRKISPFDDSQRDE